MDADRSVMNAILSILNTISFFEYFTNTYHCLFKQTTSTSTRAFPGEIFRNQF